MDAKLVLKIVDEQVHCDFQIENEKKATPELVMEALVKTAKELGDQYYNGDSAELGHYLRSLIEKEFGPITLQ